MVTPLTLLNPAAYSKDQQQAIDRWRVCRECPELKAGRCQQCGCVMKLKVRLTEATCDLGKWEA